MMKGVSCYCVEATFLSNPVKYTYPILYVYIYIYTYIRIYIYIYIYVSTFLTTHLLLITKDVYIFLYTILGIPIESRDYT